LLALLKRWPDRQSSLKWRSALESAAAQAEEDYSKAPIAQTARQVLPRRAQEFFERGDQGAGAEASPEELHRFRIVSKRFRYTLELFTPLYGVSLNPKVEAIRRVQSLLGDINDFETVRNLVGRWEGGEMVAAWLKKRQRKAMVKFREHWHKAFASEEERQNWIDLLQRLEPEPRVSKKPAVRSVTAARPAARSRAAVA
jgi:CHAD domain-containing protein